MDVYEEALRIHELHRGKLEVRSNPARGLPAQPDPRLHAWRGAALRGHRRGSCGGLEPDHEGPDRRRGLRRVRDPRPRRPRPRGVPAGDGGQGGPLQGVRRHRRGAGGARRHGPRRHRRHHPAHRSDLRRDQPRGHLGSALLRDRGAAAGPRDPRPARRPAWHGDRVPGGDPERPQGRGQVPRVEPDRHQRRRRRGPRHRAPSLVRRHERSLHPGGRAARLRQPRDHRSRPRGARSGQGGDARAHEPRPDLGHAGRRGARRRRTSSSG